MRLYLAGKLDDRTELGKQIATEELAAAMAIAEALPEISLPRDWTPERSVPERIITLPDSA